VPLNIVVRFILISRLLAAILSFCQVKYLLKGLARLKKLFDITKNSKSLCFCIDFIAFPV